MRAKQKNKTNYVDALQDEHLYAVLTKQGRVQILVSLARWTTVSRTPVAS